MTNNQKLNNVEITVKENIWEANAREFFDIFSLEKRNNLNN